MRLPASACRIKWLSLRMCIICDRWSGDNLLCRYHTRKFTHPPPDELKARIMNRVLCNRRPDPLDPAEQETK